MGWTSHLQILISSKLLNDISIYSGIIHPIKYLGLRSPRRNWACIFVQPSKEIVLKPNQRKCSIKSPEYKRCPLTTSWNAFCPSLLIYFNTVWWLMNPLESPRENVSFIEEGVSIFPPKIIWHGWQIVVMILTLQFLS